MLRPSVAIGGVLAALILGPGWAAAAPPPEAQATVADVGTISDAGPVILGTVLDSKELGQTQSDLPVSGFDASDWQLDKTLAKPVVAIADRGLAAKGYSGGLAGQGVDTGAIEQGMSLQGAAAPAGALSMPPVVSDVLTGATGMIPGAK